MDALPELVTRDLAIVPSNGPADIDVLREKIAAVDAAATALVRDSRPANTSRAYDGDWRMWGRFCDAVSMPIEVYSPGLLVAFVLYLADGDPDRGVKPAAPSTIRRRLAGAVVKLREHGVDVPKDGAKLAREAIDAFERQLAKENEKRGRGKARAITIKDLRAICQELPDTLAGHRDRAILLIGFCIGGRRVELAELLVTDVTEEPEGLLVHVRVGKTGINPDPIPVPYGTHPPTCPVRAWKTWVAAAGISDGRAFRAIDRHGNLGDSMTGQAIGQVISRAAERAGIAVRFTGHSVRSGMATEARRAGHDLHSITKQGRWAPNSREVWGYVQVVDRWADNALVGIGL